MTIILKGCFEMEEKMNNELIKATSNWNRWERRFFLRFLLKNDIYFSFIINYHNAKLYEKIPFGLGTFGNAFDWVSSDEGVGFWMVITSRWSNYYMNEKNQYLKKR